MEWIQIYRAWEYFLRIMVCYFVIILESQGKLSLKPLIQIKHLRLTLSRLVIYHFTQICYSDLESDRWCPVIVRKLLFIYLAICHQVKVKSVLFLKVFRPSNWTFYFLSISCLLIGPSSVVATTVTLLTMSCGTCTCRGLRWTFISAVLVSRSRTCI